MAFLVLSEIGMLELSWYLGSASHMSAEHTSLQVGGQGEREGHLDGLRPDLL
jgi:hypothetical protein